MGNVRAGQAVFLTLLAIVGLYALLLVLLSVPFWIYQWPPRGGWWAFPYNLIPFR